MIRDFVVTPIAIAADDDGRIHYPTAYKLAIQARQSTKRQAENNRESYEAQTKAHYRKALRLGWLDADIMMFIENKRKDGKVIDASGTLRMDERPTLQELIHYVENDEVKAIMTRGVDRLFRHVDMIEPAIFAKICKQHNCIIITDTHVYDFNKRYDDTKLFLQEAQAGADYIKKHIGMMLQYKQEKALRGEWDGRMVPVGFVLDEDRLWYVEYEPHSRVVKWVFRRFRQLSGNFAALWKEVCQVIAEQGYLFPTFPTDAHASTLAATSTDGGYVLTEAGLKVMLVNPAYLGWWLVYETVDKGMPTQRKVLRAKIENNHPAIVDATDFWFAYNRLVEQPSQRSRYSKVGTIPCDALLEGVITGEKYPVYVFQRATSPDKAKYVIVDPGAVPYNKTYGSIGVRELDAIFSNHLLAKLEAGKKLREQYDGCVMDGQPLADLLDYHENIMFMQLQHVIQQQAVSTAGIDTQLLEYTEEAESLDRTLHYGAAKLSPEKIEEYAERLARLHVSIDQLQYKQKRAAAAQEALAKFSKKLDDIPAVWYGEDLPEDQRMTLEDKKRFVHLVVDKLILTKPSPNWLQLEIQWLWDDAPSDVCYIWQRQGNGRMWSDAENALLRQMYPSADRASILQAFPDRRWSAISNQAATLGLSRLFQWNNSAVPRWVSLDDAAFMVHVGIVLEEKQRYWWMTANVTDKSSALAVLSARRKSRRSSPETGSPGHSASS